MYLVISDLPELETFYTGSSSFSQCRELNMSCISFIIIINIIALPNLVSFTTNRGFLLSNFTLTNDCIVF